MLHIVLFEPEIPPNTGNIMRLCANTGACLHLIEPLGFSLDERRLRRAGLDYRDFAEVRVHEGWEAFLEETGGRRIFAFSRNAGHSHATPAYQNGDMLLFGPETRGLPASLMKTLPETQQLRIPMVPDRRSLNLSNAVAIALYEAWRQLGFPGGEPK
jgi:tRNA-specific 2-thiouridylase/tRNA (cytidine/uridine-2'-O-)-methyltransferase